MSDVVVLDESYATTKFTRSYGRSPVGEARRPGAARDWKFLTIIAAISIDGVLAGASIDASTDADVFGSFVTDVLAPSLRPGQVVVKSVRC